MKIITSIGTLLLLENETLILRGCNLSAILPRSTFTKYHLLCSQYPFSLVCAQERGAVGEIDVMHVCVCVAQVHV